MNFLKKLFSTSKAPNYSPFEKEILQELSSNPRKVMLCQVKIHMTSHQGADNLNAFNEAGIKSEYLRNKILEQYTWHYLDDMDHNLTCTMQLVLTEALEAAKPFIDSRALYEKFMGIEYQGMEF